MMRVVILIACAMVLHVSAASAASPMMKAYKAYAAALGKGDVATANREGEKAWQAAEKAGNAKTGAILAYNLAELRLHYLPKSDAATPAARAYELVQTNPDGGLAIANARLLAVLTAPAPEKTSAASRALQKAVRAFEKAGLEMTYPCFRAYMQLMQYNTRLQYWGFVRKDALAAQKAYAALGMKNKNVLAMLKINAAAALLFQSNFKKSKQAREEMREVFKILGPWSYGNHNPLMLRASTWLTAMSSAEQSLGISPVYKNKHKSAKKGKQEKQQSTVAGCPAIKWLKREAPAYPPELEKMGNAGEVLIRYSVDEAGVPKDVRIVDEAAAPMFGKYAAAAVLKWRAKPMHGVPAKCRENMETPFHFLMSQHQSPKQQMPAGGDCPDIVWLKREAPEYPSKLAKQGYFGAALIQYSVDEEGVPNNVRVADEVPSPRFGKYAAAVVPHWRAKPLHGVPAKCLENRITPFVFSLRQ